MAFKVETMKGLTDLVMHGEGIDTFADLDLHPEDLEDMAGLWLLATTWKTAANKLEKLIAAELVGQLDGGKIDVGDQRVFTTKGTWKETCIDTSAFLLWLEANPGHAVRVINPNNVKKASLPPAVRDTFFERTKVYKPDTEPVPTAVPIQVLEDNKTRKAL